jgi:hypothetical protein
VRIALLFVIFLLGCSDPPYLVHERLETLLQDDLRYTVADIQKHSGKEAVLDTPYFVIRDLRQFHGDTANLYSYYADVDFYYFKNVKMAQKRKYRYDALRHYWDRYSKVLFFTKE